jgi:hypothetical protein
MLHEFHQDSGSTITIHEENESRIALTKNIMTIGRSKHMDVRYHLCREMLESGDIEVQYRATENMLADVLIKPLVTASVQCHHEFACVARGSVERHRVVW